MNTGEHHFEQGDSVEHRHYCTAYKVQERLMGGNYYFVKTGSGDLHCVHRLDLRKKETLQ
jgi:hypothetical protein